MNVSLNFAFSLCLVMEKYIVICSFRTGVGTKQSLFFEGRPERRMPGNVKKIGLWFLSIVVPLRSWAKSLALSAFRSSLKTWRGLPASHHLKMFLYAHILASSSFSCNLSSFLSRSTFSSLAFFPLLFPLWRNNHKNLNYLISFLFHGSVMGVLQLIRPLFRIHVL